MVPQARGRGRERGGEGPQHLGQGPQPAAPAVVQGTLQPADPQRRLVRRQTGTAARHLGLFRFVSHMCVCGGVCGATDNAAGSGKTTLLNSLAGRMQAEGWTRYLTPRPTDIVADGDVLFNGVSKTPKEIRRIAAYVMQKVRSTWAYLISRAACVVACTRSHFSFTCVLRNHCRTTFYRTSPFAKPSPTPVSSPFPPACRSLRSSSSCATSSASYLFIYL